MTIRVLTDEQWEAMKADPLYQQFVSAAVRALTAMLTGQPQPSATDQEKLLKGQGGEGTGAACKG